MGCVLSRKLEEEDVVALCKERKRLLKMAVERRCGFAEAQCKYNYSLYAVAAAIRVLVARYSSTSSPFLITFPSASSETSEISISNPILVQQRASEPINEKEEEEEEEEEEEVCEHFYDEMAPLIPSPQRNFGWDFFHPFGGFDQNFDGDLRAVREREGIPDLEEDREIAMSERKAVDVNNDNVVCVEDCGIEGVREGDDVGVKQEEEKCLKVIDTPTNGRELLEALKDVVDLFLRSYDSGLDVSRMLETNMGQIQSTMEEIKENSNKLIQSFTRSRSNSSTLSWSSSCKSLLTSSSKSSSGWTEFNLFDDFRRMESGSHSLTLARLYAWEKKLFADIKIAEETRKIYEQKCSQLRKHDAYGDEIGYKDKGGPEVKYLYSRTLVAIKSAESISERIQKLRDEELQPQLVELLYGLMRNWKIMLETHETQNRIMNEVRSFNCSAYGKFCNDSHRLATLQLEVELQNWQACFVAYFTSQKAYLEALNGWLCKFITPETEFYSKGMNRPPLLVMCHDWLVFLDKLPDKAVVFAMKSFRRNIRALLCQQGEEQQQKRKVDGLAKELERKVEAFQREERRVPRSKLSLKEVEMQVRKRVEYLTEKKDQLEMFKKRLEMEKEKHQSSMQETKSIAINGFQIGFSLLFESLAEFSNASVKMYGELVKFCANLDADEKGLDDSSKE